MVSDSGIEPKLIKVDGGVSKNDCLLKLQADILNKEVLRPENIETTSLGAAFAAGLAAGVWGSKGELRKVWKADKVFKPEVSKEVSDERYR